MIAALFTMLLGTQEPRHQPIQKPAPLPVLRIFCMPDRKCPPCAHFHMEENDRKLPLRAFLRGYCIERYSDTSNEAVLYGIERFPTFQVESGGRTRDQVGYFGYADLIDFLLGRKKTE